jgi:alpha-L-fucosidase 2
MNETTRENLSLWYEKPAANWNEALPIGNGRLGAMVFGGVPVEHLQLNDNTLYSGEPGDRDLPLDVAGLLPRVRQWLKEEKYEEVHAWVTKHWLGRAQNCYQPLGDLFLEFTGHDEVAGYHRELNLADAVARTRYEQNGVLFTREIFASHPARAIVIRLHASQPGALNFVVRLRSVHPTARTTLVPGQNALSLRGQVPGFALRRGLATVRKKGEMWKYPEIFDERGELKPGAGPVLYGDLIGGRGTRFDACVLIQETDGEVVQAAEGVLGVRGAAQAVLIFSSGSSFNGFDKSPSREGKDESAEAAEALAAACGQKFEQLKEAHSHDYRSLFERVTLSLGAPTAQTALPTAERLTRYAQGGDEALAALYYQYGRYLLIAGSRPGGQPLNLQGMWNAHVVPPWAGAYTLNINLEMNYWPAEAGNLTECGEPYRRMIGELARNGRQVARDMYRLPGWVAHHNTTIWRDAQPIDGDAGPAFWNMAAPWLCNDLWDHFEFTGDVAFLREIYPVLKGAAEFMNAWLVEDDDGCLVTPAGTSPESKFLYTDADGALAKAAVLPGPTMDQALIRDLFAHCIEASRLLAIDEAFRQELEARLPRLLPYRIGSRGQLQEWPHDFADEEPDHRHVSHLWGAFPGNDITIDGTPKLAAAVARSLELRGDQSTGWGLAWRINLWARLREGTRALQSLTSLLAPDRSHPNLLDICPPFQIDGNFGAAAGIAEMLLQSDGREIHLLPALPGVWSDGSFSGFRARGGFEVGCRWRAGRVESATVRSVRASACRIRSAGKSAMHTLREGETARLDANLERIAPEAAP